jgi:hypothetical protein
MLILVDVRTTNLTSSDLQTEECADKMMSGKEHVWPALYVAFISDEHTADSSDLRIVIKQVYSTEKCVL